MYTYKNTGDYLKFNLLAMFSILADNILSHSDIPLIMAAISPESDEFIAAKYFSRLEKTWITYTCNIHHTNDNKFFLTLFNFVLCKLKFT